MDRGDPLIFFDDGQGRFAPLSDLRPVCELRTGALTTRDRWQRLLGRTASAVFVPTGLAPLAVEMLPGVEVNPGPDAPLLRGPRCLLINARLALAGEEMVADLCRPGELGSWEASDGSLLAARLPGGSVAALARTAFRGGAWRHVAPSRPLRHAEQTLFMHRPWNIVQHLETLLRADLNLLQIPEFRPDPGAAIHVVPGHVIRVHPSARVHPMTVLNAEKGPIVIDDHAIVGSFTVLAGPCYVGPHAIIGPQSHIRANTVIGPQCVAAGEISHTVMHGRSNKSHAGYLGHALVGEWVNLGADTNASNLKNTYGNVRVTLNPPLSCDQPALPEAETKAVEEDSNLQKLGPVIGDFVRTAIGARINTGACLGTGSMVACDGFTPKSVGRFRFLTEKGDQPYDIEKFLQTARAMMSRRKLPLSPALEARLRAAAMEPSP